MAVSEVDYLIIGAGLAGLTLQHFLEQGTTAIVDPHPARYKLGESIIPEHFRDPAFAPLLAAVQGLPSYSPKRGSLYIGEDSVAAFPLPPMDYPLAMHVRREELEECMASLWRTPVERERVVHIDFEQGLVRTNVRTWRVAKQILDCSGIARVVARARGDDHEIWPSYSSWMYFDISRVVDERFDAFLKETGRAYARLDAGVGKRLPPTEYEGWSPSNSTIVRRVRDGMFAWQIPLYRKSVLSFGVTSRHGPISREDLLEIARACIAPCYEVSARPFDGSSQYNRYHIYNRFSRRATQIASDRWILVGDAGFFGEPIYATGTAVAVNQALHLARSLNDGGWTREKAEDYTARGKRLVMTSMRARKYFFSPDEADPPPSEAGLFADRGIEGTAFQLTMANNYGLILSGVKQFVLGEQEFGSSRVTSAEEQRRCTERVLALLAPGSARAEGWTVRTAYRVEGGLQLACSHPNMPDLTLRLERSVAGRRYFLTAGGVGVAYMSLPDRPYPMEGAAVQLVNEVVASLHLMPQAWHALIPAASAR